MKKIISCFTLSLLLCFSLVFTGCGNSSKTLAKKLDDTIASLVYSVSSLDWADSSIISNISGSNLDSTLDDNNLVDTNNLSQDNNCRINDNLNDTTYQNNHNNQTQSHFPQVEPYSAKENNCLSTHHEINNRCNQYPTDNIARNNNLNMRPMPDLANENVARFANKENHLQYHNNQENINNYELKPGMSGTDTARIRFSNNTVSKITDRANNLNENNIATSSSSMVVNYSTNTIEESKEEIQQRISSLIDKRAKLLLFINDLYKGNIKLSEESLTAINAYINIIKDNTSYLNSNRGIISNQLNRANNLYNSNSASPLINAYIIRTNEAIDTRLAKLDSSLLAIDSICNILNSNLTSSSPYYNQNILSIIDNTNSERKTNRMHRRNKLDNTNNNQINNLDNLSSLNENIKNNPNNRNSINRKIDPIQENNQIINPNGATKNKIIINKNNANNAISDENNMPNNTTQPNIISQQENALIAKNDDLLDLSNINNGTYNDSLINKTNNNLIANNSALTDNSANITCPECNSNNEGQTHSKDISSASNLEAEEKTINNLNKISNNTQATNITSDTTTSEKQEPTKTKFNVINSSEIKPERNNTEIKENSLTLNTKNANNANNNENIDPNLTKSGKPNENIANNITQTSQVNKTFIDKNYNKNREKLKTQNSEADSGLIINHNENAKHVPYKTDIEPRITTLENNQIDKY